MKKRKAISVLILAAAAAMPAAAATAAAREPISTAQVAGAISNAGVNISAQQVTLLADVAATTPDPTLVMESMERWGDHRMKVRMNCANAECVPFYVAIQWGQTEPIPAAFANRAATGAVTAKVAPGAVVLRAGSTAILMLEGDHVHIQLPVVCLESGAVGQTIRVASRDHKQTFVAQVGDATLLKGSTQ
jgi:hypothetical protein